MIEALETLDSQRGTPPNREVCEDWVARRMALAGGSASPVSRRGAPENNHRLHDVELFNPNRSVRKLRKQEVRELFSGIIKVIWGACPLAPTKSLCASRNLPLAIETCRRGMILTLWSPYLSMRLLNCSPRSFVVLRSFWGDSPEANRLNINAETPKVRTMLGLYLSSICLSASCD